MPIPDYQSLMLPVLSASLDGEIRIGDVVERLAEKLSLTPEERSQLLPSGKQTVFANRVHWAKTYLGKAGLIESTRRGYFKITASGRQVVESKPARIDNNFLSQFEEFEKWRGSDQEVAAEQLSAAPAIVNQKETPDEIMRAAQQTLFVTAHAAYDPNPTSTQRSCCDAQRLPIGRARLSSSGLGSHEATGTGEIAETWWRLGDKQRGDGAHD
jgi:restriction endonuclease Mrr